MEKLTLILVKNKMKWKLVIFAMFRTFKFQLSINSSKFTVVLTRVCTYILNLSLSPQSFDLKHRVRKVNP